MPLKNISISILIILLISSCRTTELSSIENTKQDDKYDSEFPNKSVSDELKYISNTIKKLDIIAFYATYYFPAETIEKKVINDSIIDIYEDQMVISHEAVSGTATVIYNNSNTIGLLTCAHVVDFPDSVFAYYDKDKQFIQSVSIKIKQQNHISGFSDGEPIEIVAMDTDHDIAILKKIITLGSENINTLKYPVGKTKDLQWGSLVYIMGYPLGNLMVTRALVSITDKIKSGFFVTDALYNHGISGAPVFAIRDGVPNFELVGMASSSAAQESNILVPHEEYKNDTRLKTNYVGDIFVDNNKLISYGVTYSVTINEIITFIHSNEKALTLKGFNINSFFM